MRETTLATTETYPKIGRRNWALVRDRFKKTLPREVTPTFIASVKPMAEGSAKANVINPLRQLGLLDETNKPTDLATRWRHDDEYASVCHEIRNKTYPSELLEAFPDADSNQKEQISIWFMKAGNVGKAAAQQYTETYLLLTEADPARLSVDKASNVPPSKNAAPKSAKKQRPGQKAEVQAQPVALEIPRPLPAEPTQASIHRRLPAIHIDVQVHISPETSAEQIDRIFESMAKHLGSYIR